MKIKVITFNIWDIPLWLSVKRHERANLLGTYLKDLEADIIFLQEAFDVKHRELIHENLGRDVYHIIEEYDESRRALLFKRFDLTGGLVTFSKFPISASSFTPFRRPLRLALPERVGRKGFLRAVLETPVGPILAVNTHLYAGRGKSNDRIRNEQLEQLLAHTQKNDSMPATILAGDLNEHRLINKSALLPLLKEAGFKDSATGSKNENDPTCTPTNPYTDLWLYHRHRASRLDFIFSRENKSLKLKTENYKVLPRAPFPLSDHEAVMTEFLI